MGDGRGVAGILELPEHLRVREDLTRVCASEFEHLSQQGRFVHTGEQQDVPRQNRFYERISDVADPAIRLLH